ncbi:MAG: hypothetical protein Q4F31_09970 [Eubacteriales bacterium]|nr:hypothetical protein [Eubacteriales bacterium]
MTTMKVVPRTAGMPLMAESPGVWKLRDEELLKVAGGVSTDKADIPFLRAQVLIVFHFKALATPFREDFANWVVENQAGVAAGIIAAASLSVLTIGYGIMQGMIFKDLPASTVREIGRWVWDKVH